MTPAIANRPTHPGRGFTLVELLTVLVVLAVSVTVMLPYARKSNDAQLLERECRGVAETIKYAVSGAGDTRKPFRFIVDRVQKVYRLEVATDSSGNEYVPVADGQLMSFPSSGTVKVMDVQGFRVLGEACYGLVFDPSQAWPTASLALVSSDTAKRIVVQGRLVSIEDI